MTRLVVVVVVAAKAPWEKTVQHEVQESASVKAGVAVVVLLAAIAASRN